jgi:hypothetical protein
MVVGHGGDNNWGQNSMREQNRTHIQINNPAPTKRGGLQRQDTKAGDNRNLRGSLGAGLAQQVDE